MKNQLKISENDRRLLFLLFSLIVIAVSYFFIYTKNNNQTNEINESNEVLKARVEELYDMQAQMDLMKEEIQVFTQETEKIKALFPPGLKTEDTIVMLVDLEKAADMKISSATFAMNELFSPSADFQQESEETTSEESEEEAVNLPNVGILFGYKSTITIAYQTNYAGLKKAIDYINQNPDQMTIGDLSAAYDTSTGNLMGSMSIHMYSLIGTDKVYEAPFIDGINIGLKNIFGTIEIQK